MIRKPNRRPAVLALLLSALLLSACGFQPRGQTLDLSAIPGPVHITGIRPYSPLARALQKEFKAAGLPIANGAAESGSTLRFTRYDKDSRVLSVNNRNKAVEYELEESAEFALYQSGGSELTPPQTVRVLRILLRPSDAILGANREEVLLREDMRHELAQRIVRRLAARR